MYICPEIEKPEMISEKNKILILDGAMGTMIQKHGLSERDYNCGPFEGWDEELTGNSECLNLTRPEIILDIHREYIRAGADIIESNTFSANRISQAEYGCEEWAGKMAFEGARLARLAADEVSSERKVWVAGSIGPTSKSLSLSPDASDPMFRPYSFEQMKEAYREQVEALVRGGVDIFLIETCFDALNVKAVLAAIDDACHHACISEDPRLRSTQAPPSRGWHVFSNTMHDVRSHRQIPVIVSVSVGDRSGRTLTGQTLEAFHTSVKHGGLMAFGVNCSLGAAELMPLVEDIGKWCGCAVCCYPNAGLPNEMGGYDQSPEDMAAQVREMAVRGLVNIVGGCCGTTPEHIRAIAQAVDGLAPRSLSSKTGHFEDGNAAAGGLKVSGLEAVNIDAKVNNFTNVGERTNVAGSRKFARLISEGRYEEGLQIAAKQIEDGASVIDINMDDAMLDSTREMERFVRCISNDPDVAKAALMIDSSRWETIIAGLQNAQGKCIVNSISLKEGAEAFVEKARIISSFGAAVVVMAFDEQGQATTFERKIEICGRAYDLLTREVGMNPCDIIFDVNILSIGTGIEEHARYAVDFIEAVRWIKANLPGALTSGGVSNLSFAFRGNNAVREAMHSAFLYHAIRAGLDMAIVNPSMLQVYDEIDPELLKCVEDVIFDTDPQATERLIDKASRMLADSHAGAGEAHSHPERSGAKSKNLPPVSLRLQNSLIKGRTDTLETDIREALEEFGSAVAVIEGPLMAGMETVGKLFGEGKMFLPQVVKSAKVMRDAVNVLEPYMNLTDSCSEDHAPDFRQEGHVCHVGQEDLDCHVVRAERVETSVSSKRSTVILATVKGDVHDIGKNITGIVLTCNGFDVHDLGVMVDKETILEEALKAGADIVAVSGLITPSLYQMEELCREMSARGMTTPLFIGGATTSAVHTAVKLAPLYDHVFYGPDASAAAVMAKKCMMDRETFEAEQHAEQEKIRKLYDRRTASQTEPVKAVERGFKSDTYLTDCPADIPVCELDASEVLPFLDWKMFYAIWGVKYGGAVPEAMELMQLRRDAEDEIALGDFRIMLTARFFMGCSTETDCIRFEANGEEISLPMMRQEGGKEMSLCDFVIPEQSGRKSPLGMFAVSVHKKSKAHVHGCSCPACSNQYEDMVGRTVRMTLAEAASAWLDALLLQGPPSHRFAAATPSGRGWHVPSSIKASDHQATIPIKVIKPAAGYASCPDHTLKGDILHILGGHGQNDGHVFHDSHSCTCGECHETDSLGIELTESYAMVPESSICGLIFMHPEATYPQIRRISPGRYEEYAERRGMDEEKARRFLGHLLE